jgi:competence protein ComEC
MPPVRGRGRVERPRESGDVDVGRISVGYVLALTLTTLCIPLKTYAQDDTERPLLRITFIDVGQGDAIWIHGPDMADGEPGGDLIIDGGPDQGDNNRLLKYLRNNTYGLGPSNPIDCIVASHPHVDHYPGLMDVLSAYEVRQIFDTGYPKALADGSGRPSVFARFRSAAQRETADGKKSKFIELSKTPQSTINCGNITANVLHAYTPSEKMGNKANTQENNSSIALRLVFGKFSFLFMGDGEGQDRDAGGQATHFVEEFLLKEARTKGVSLKSTVLKAAHHGSDTSSTIPFIKAVNPDVVVIMSGRKTFGIKRTYLPDKVVLDRYLQVNPKVTIVRTDQDDARERRTPATDADGDDVYMYTDGDTLKISISVPVSNAKRKWRVVKTLKATT